MYRLPSQFDLAGRQDDLSAAGGGSTSTSCCSCLVTASAASLITAIHFVNLVPKTVPTPGSQAAPETVTGVTAAADPQTGALASPPPRQPMAAWLRGTLGATAIALAVVAVFMVSGVSGVLMPEFSIPSGLLTFLAAYIAIFGFVYDRSGKSAQRGVLRAIVTVIAIAVCSVGEAIVWMGGL